MSKPCKTFGLGRITTSVFINTTDHTPYFNASLQRSYKDSEGEWHRQTIHLNETEVAAAAGILEDTRRFLADHNAADQE